MVTRDTYVTAEFIAEMTAAAAGLPCPRCGVVGQITARERWVRQAVPQGITRGPLGFPVVAECGACGSRGLAAEKPRGYRS